MKYLRCYSIFVAMAATVVMASAHGGHNQNLPRDNDAVTVHRTTLLTAGEEAEEGQTPVWDFSGAKVTDANLVWRYSWCGDYLLRVATPDAATVAKLILR